MRHADTSKRILINTFVNTIHPAPEIHEHFMIQRLRNIVHNLKHTFTYIETTVPNCVNAMTHTDVITAHH